MTLTLGAVCLAAIAALLNVSVTSNLNLESFIAVAQSASNVQASGQTIVDCLKALVPFVLLLAVGQRLWAQSIATAMVMGAVLFQSLPPIPTYADQLLPYRIGVFTPAPQTMAQAGALVATPASVGRYQ